MKKIIFATDDHLSSLALRLTLGLVVFAHGAQKLLGVWGGFGFTNTMNFFTTTVGLPWLVGLAVIVLEFFGALLLLMGLVTRIIAMSYVILAFGIVTTSHLQYGFFMNWFGTNSGEGYEFFLLWIGMAAALAIDGGGKFSLDRKFFN
ncbi:MAG: DoxX family protein [Flammeovirgaceae bacterium]